MAREFLCLVVTTVYDNLANGCGELLPIKDIIHLLSRSTRVTNRFLMRWRRKAPFWIPGYLAAPAWESEFVRSARECFKMLSLPDPVKYRGKKCRQRYKSRILACSKVDRRSKRESPENNGPNGLWRNLEYPEFGAWMMHDGDSLPFGAGNLVIVALKVDGVVVVDPSRGS